MEGKLLQTAASPRTFFVLVISARALKSFVPFLGIFELGMPKTPCYVRVFWSKSLLPDFQRSFKKRLGLRIPILVLRSSLLVGRLESDPRRVLAASQLKRRLANSIRA